MTPNPTSNANLTGGLRRVLLGFFFVVCALAAAQIVAVSRLQSEIGHWAWTSEINGLREDLLQRSYDLLGNDENADLSDVLNAFETLREAIETGRDFPEDEDVARRFVMLETEARALFLRAEENKRLVAPLKRDIQLQVDRLQELSGTWAAQIRSEEPQLLRESRRIDSRSREKNDLKASLTEVLLAAQLMQQQVIAIERLIQTATPDVIRSSVASLDTTGMPAVCAPGEQEANGRICSPSPARALSALERLRTQDVDTVPQNVNLALLGLQGYLRAGQGRLDALAREDTETLASARAVRDRLTELKSLNSSLARINRVLRDIEVSINQPVTNSDRLDATARQMRSFVSQIEIRMTGLLKNAPELDGNTDSIAEITARISNDWNAMRDLKAERIDTLEKFDSTMETLSFDIARHADQVRSDTTVWVKLYSSNFLLLAAAMIASVIGLFWAARRRFIIPLSGVTGAILGLARGELDRPIKLDERAFGFDTLGQALERLRLEMVERHRLSERNNEQQKIIESNLMELERTSEEMEWMAMHDPLTGLGNRRQADLELESLTKDRTCTRQDFCMMQIDIDRFKTINDALGHPAGDFVLKTVSDILRSSAGPKARCYRIGGDEFLVVWPIGCSSENASGMADQIIRRIEAPIDFDGHRCNVGASIGIAFGHDSDFDAMQCVLRADLALYQAKKAGRGAFRFFTEDLAQLSSRRKEISDRLLAAIESRAFVPFYQPQFLAATRELRGVEILCRWHDDDLGWISPGEFLSVADELDAVGKIDEILFDKVALDVQKLAEMGLSLPKISFNVTADRLLRADLARDLSGRIGTYSRIALELLESMSLDNPTESLTWALDELREHGIDIEIDDFGSDRASLAGLMAISPQCMKIDRAIVMPIVESQRHRDLVKKIIDIGNALDVEVVAEGVESEEHAELLSALGCDSLQGFGLAMPMPFEDLVAFCESRAQTSGGNSSAVA